MSKGDHLLTTNTAVEDGTQRGCVIVPAAWVKRQNTNKGVLLLGGNRAAALDFLIN